MSNKSQVTTKKSTNNINQKNKNVKQSSTNNKNNNIDKQEEVITKKPTNNINQKNKNVKQSSTNNKKNNIDKQEEVTSKPAYSKNNLTIQQTNKNDIVYDAITGEVIAFKNNNAPKEENDKIASKKIKWTTILLALLIPMIGLFTFFAVMYENGSSTSNESNNSISTPDITSSSLSTSISYGPEINVLKFMELFLESYISQIMNYKDEDDFLVVEFKFNDTEALITTSFSGLNDYYKFNIVNNEV